MDGDACILGFAPCDLTDGLLTEVTVKWPSKKPVNSDELKTIHIRGYREVECSKVHG